MGEIIDCEVCHKPYNVKEMAELRDKYKNEIYRPGEDLSRYENLTEAEMSERRREIAEIFADPEGYREQQEQEQEQDV